MPFLSPNFRPTTARRVTHMGSSEAREHFALCSVQKAPPEFAQQSEKEFAEWMFERLAPYFEVKEQVRGMNAEHDTILRVDAVITLKEDPTKVYALELKKPVLGSKCIDAGHLLRQAVDYRYTIWNGYGKLPVLICPGFEGRLQTDGTAHPVRDYATYSRIAAAFGIGELMFTYSGDLCIKFAGSHEHWYSHRGLTSDGRTWRLPGARVGH